MSSCQQSVDRHVSHRVHDLAVHQMYYRGEFRKELGDDYVESYSTVDERIPRILRLPDCAVWRACPTYSPRGKGGPRRRTTNCWVCGGGRDGLKHPHRRAAGREHCLGTGQPNLTGRWISVQLAMIERLLLQYGELHESSLQAAVSTMFRDTPSLAWTSMMTAEPSASTYCLAPQQSATSVFTLLRGAIRAPSLFLQLYGDCWGTTSRSNTPPIHRRFQKYIARADSYPFP